MTESTTVQITDPQTKAFYAGVGVGSDLIERIAADEQLSKATHEEKVAWYWLYVGAAAQDKDITGETMLNFVQGATTRAPSRHEEFVLSIDTSGLVDPTDESEYALGYAVTRLLARMARDENVAYDDKGHVWDGPVGSVAKAVGTWQVFH